MVQEQSKPGRAKEETVLERKNEDEVSGSFKQRFGFPGGSDSKESACNAEDQSSVPGGVRSPGEENGGPLQYSCLENSMDRGAWRATVHGVTKSWK